MRWLDSSNACSLAGQYATTIMCQLHTANLVLLYQARLTLYVITGQYASLT